MILGGGGAERAKKIARGAGRGVREVIRAAAHKTGGRASIIKWQRARVVCAASRHPHPRFWGSRAGGRRNLRVGQARCGKGIRAAAHKTRGRASNNEYQRARIDCTASRHPQPRFWGEQGGWAKKIERGTAGAVCGKGIRAVTHKTGGRASNNEYQRARGGRAASRYPSHDSGGRSGRGEEDCVGRQARCVRK